MSEHKDHDFTEATHNSGEHVSQEDIRKQDGIGGWQGAVGDETRAQGRDDADPDEPAVE